MIFFKEKLRSFLPRLSRHFFDTRAWIWITSSKVADPSATFQLLVIEEGVRLESDLGRREKKPMGKSSHWKLPVLIFDAGQFQGLIRGEAKILQTPLSKNFSTHTLRSRLGIAGQQINNLVHVLSMTRCSLRTQV